MKYSIFVGSLLTLAVIYISAQQMSLKEARDRLTALETIVTDLIKLFDNINRTLSSNFLEKDLIIIAEMMERSGNISANTTDEANFFVAVAELESEVHRHREILLNVTVREEYEFISLIGRGQSLIARESTAMQTYRVVLSDIANSGFAKLFSILTSQLISSVRDLYDGVSYPPEQRQFVKENFLEIEKRLTEELDRLPHLSCTVC